VNWPERRLKHDMQKRPYTLYWEDVDERLIYAQHDDRSWLLAEEMLGYKKADSLYIYHQGKLSAFYSKKDTEEEARLGYEFYSDEKNVAEVIEIKKESKRKMDAFLLSGKDLRPADISTPALVERMLQTLDYQTEALRAHFLDQPQFFERFESEGDVGHVERFEALGKARYEYSRQAWSLGLGFNHRLFEEYGRRSGLCQAEAESMTREELASGIFDRGLLKERSDKYVIHSAFHEHTIISGSAVDEYIQTYERHEDTGQVTGLIGNKGIVRARAFVLKNEHLDLRKLPAGMEKGMVLIVQNAWPELAAYYPLASAIVANEGGITSHGVVVAREFGIPCIVATRIGTKVFNTGDMVEVDAERGVVTIIERADERKN